MQRVIPARLFLIPAFEAPKCVVVRRKPSKRWHVMLWDTETDKIDHGSWFSGTLYPHRFDLSWDGKWLVYFAMGNEGNWTGICNPPKLTTIRYWPQTSTYLGGGVFAEKDLLLLNPLYYPGSPQSTGSVPFKIQQLKDLEGSEDEGVLYPRLRRDGWKDVGRPSKQREGWWNQPTEEHPVLRMWFRGTSDRRRQREGGFRVFDFQLDSRPELLKGVRWATWDCLGQLLVARRGAIERYTLADLSEQSPEPSFQLDLNELEPAKKKRTAPHNQF